MGEPKAHWVDDPHRLWDYAGDLNSAHSGRLQLDRACLRLGYPRPNFNETVLDQASGYLVKQSGYDAIRDLGHSLTHEVAGAAGAQICRPLQVKVVPSDRDFELINQCEEASTAANGVLDGNDFLVGTAQRVVMDGLHCCVGFAKVAVDRASGDLEVGRVDPMLMRWPRDQGADLFDIVELQSIPRRRLLADHADDPAAVAAIKQAKTWRPPTIPGVEDSLGFQVQSDCVKVVEAFAVKLGDTPGRHVIAIEGAVLLDEEYDHDVLPYAPYRWSWDFRGFDGVSLARTVAPYDVWSRELVRMHFKALAANVPIIWLREGETAFEGFTDVEYQIGRYNGSEPPVVKIAGTVSQDVVAQIQALRERAFAQAGVSIQAAQGQIPPGFKSAPSINAWSEVVNLRSLQQQQQFEAFYATVGKLVCLFAPDAYKGRKISVRSANAEYLRSVRFPNLSKNKYRVTVLMTSGLPRTFSGRVESIGALKALGAVKPGTEARYLEVPDLEAVNGEALASRRLAESIVSGALDRGELPEFGVPDMPELLAELLPHARARYQRALDNGTYPPESLSALHRVIRLTESMQAPPVPPPGPDAGPPPPGDQAALPPVPGAGAPPPMLPPPPPPDVPPMPADALAQVPV
jgi:hypothetical protein